MNIDCSIPAVAFTFGYTIINLALFSSTIYAFYKFWKHYKSSIDKDTPKPLFYTGLVFFLFSSIMMLITFRNAMFICFHGDINHMNLEHWIYFVIFYGLQTYWLWLVLFLRLKYVFDGSSYCLSKLTIRIYLMVFIFIPFATPLYLAILWFVDNNLIYTIILSISFVFIIIFSCSLIFIFVSKLIQVYKSMNINVEGGKKESVLNNKLLTTITKTSILAIVSLSMTLLALISILFASFAISYHHTKAVCEAGLSLLAFITLADVYTNYLCILVSYNFFHIIYVSICIKCDKKCKMYCIKKLSQKKRIMLGSRTMTPVDGGEGTNSETFKFSQSAENIVNGEIEDTHSNQIVHQTDSTNIYQQIDTVADEEIVIQT
eukprot:233115_1